MSRVSRDLAGSAHHREHVTTTSPSRPGSRNNDRATVMKSRPAGPRIAVVGAGMAGLRCSAVLARHGVDVVLFEARDRIGGRVHQQRSGGYLVDMGPNWIHGTKGNPIMELAERTKTAIFDPNQGDALFDVDGLRRPDAEATALAGRIWGMVADAFKYSDEHSAEIDPQTSLLDYFNSRLDEVERHSGDHNHGLKREDILREAEMWGPFVGDPIQRQSLKFFWLEECIEGETVFVASTYHDILKEVGRMALHEPATNAVDLRLGTEIVHFDTSKDPQDTEAGVRITTAAGQKHDFDHVVLTAPLGWLKRNKSTAFTPPFPARISQAIDNINYGRLEKLYVTFPSAFWLDANGTDTSSYPAFTHFHDPKYVSHPRGESWNQSVVSLAHLPGENAQPTLLFYIYGPCATWIVEQVRELTPNSEAYNQALISFAEPFYSRLPHYSPSTNKACIPTAFLMTQWQNDRLAGNGSYCNFQTGLENADEDIEVIRDAGELGASKGLWLAGEHTAPFIALGTTTGAYWSGEAVAKRICAQQGLLRGDEAEGLPENAEQKDGAVTKHNGTAANLNGLAI